MTQFNPENERIKTTYFTFEKEANGKSEKTIENIRKALIRYEEHTKYDGFKTFSKKRALEFKADLLKVKNKYGKPLSASTIMHTLAPLKEFFKWLSMQAGYKKRIIAGDIIYLSLQEKDKRSLQSCKVKDYPSCEQIRAVLASMPSNTVIEKRNRALIAFVFCTGVRDGALISLKLKHINPDKKRVIQDPKEVKTKFSKTINTHFYPVGDDVHDIVMEWVKFLREEMFYGDADPLFSKEKQVYDASEGFQSGHLSREHWASASPVRILFKQAFESAGMTYSSPHRFRDTLAALGRNLCVSTSEQLAWARNMGHESPATTFGVYGYQSPEEQFEVIARLGEKKPEDMQKMDFASIAAELAKHLKHE
jgi:integrase/recombinase XerD